MAPQAAAQMYHYGMAPTGMSFEGSYPAPMAMGGQYPTWQKELENLAASQEPPMTVEEYVRSLRKNREDMKEMKEFLEMIALEEGYATLEEWKLSKREEMATYREKKAQAQAQREATLEAVAAHRNVTVEELKAQIEAHQMEQKALKEEAVEVLAEAEGMTVEEYKEKMKEEREEDLERFQAIKDKCEEASGEDIKALQQQIAEDREIDLMALKSDPYFESDTKALRDAAQEVLEVYAGKKDADEVTASNPDGKTALQIIADYHGVSVDDLVDDRSALEEIRVEIAECAGYDSVEAMEADQMAYRQEKKAEKEEMSAILEAHFGEDPSEMMKDNKAEQKEFMEDWNNAAEETGLTVTQMEMKEQRDDAKDYWNNIKERAEDEGISVQQIPSNVPPMPTAGETDYAVGGAMDVLDEASNVVTEEATGKGGERTNGLRARLQQAQDKRSRSRLGLRGLTAETGSCPLGLKC